jgi:CubicO group peptidase (beta-lactamase class C family)
VTRRLGVVAVAAPVALVALAVAVGCSRSDNRGAPGSATGTTIPKDRVGWRDVDDAMAERLRADDLPGAVDLVVRDGKVLHDASYGSYDRRTVVPIASASKWLTSAVIMTLVEEGKLSLDAPVATYLPEWAGDKQGVTLRRLLSHQAGVPGSAPCLGDPDMTLRECASSIADTKLEYAPGTEFRYGNAGYSVAAAVAEVAGGASFTRLFADRIATPLGMTATSFSGRDGRTDANPVPAAGATSTMDDYARFVAMMANDGVAPDGRRVLQASSVAEIERDQVKGLDTHDDFAVQITGFGTYGLGTWRDRADAADTTQMVSGSGSVGFYPWIDRERHAYGVLLVNDSAGGSGRAVRSSTRIVHDLILPATDNTPR